MATTKPSEDMEKLPTLPPKTDAESETAWLESPAPGSLPEPYTREVFRRDLEIVSRRITDDINRNPKEVAKLRKSVAQAEKGNRRAYRDDSDGKSS